MLNRWYIRQVVTAFLANSQATFEAFHQTFPIIGKKEHLTLNNAIDLSLWQPQPEKAHPDRIGMLARLSYEKGIDRAIEAMEILIQQCPDAELCIWGEGKEADKLREIIAGRNLEKQVLLMGFTTDIQDALASCSIFLFTPRFGEGTSIALIEAMAMGLPCVVFDTPAMAEVVSDGEMGFVVPDGETELLAERLRYLLENPDERQKLGLAARKRAEDHFSMQAQIVEPLGKWLRGMVRGRNIL